MNLRIKVLLSCIAALITIVPATYIGYKAVSDSNTAVNSVSLEFEKYATKSARNYVENALRVCQMAQKSETFYFDNASSRMKEILAKLGSASLDETQLEANIFQQDNPTKIFKNKFAPLKLGNITIAPKLDKSGNAIANPTKFASMLYAVKNDTFIDVSILSKAIETGGLLRLATTLKGKNSKLLLNSVMLDEAENAEIIRTLLARKNFFGIVKIADTRYIAVYEPIADESGEIVAAVEYLKPMNDLKYIFENFESSKLGGDGYLWSIQNINSEPSFVSAQDTQSATNEIRAEMSDILDSAISAGEGKITLKSIKYFSDDTEEKALIAFTLFKPWNIVLGATINKNSTETAILEISNRIEAKVFVLIPLFMLFVAIAVALIRVYCTKMLESVEHISKSLQLTNSFSAKQNAAELASCNVYFSELRGLQKTVIVALRKISESLNMLEEESQKLINNVFVMSEKSGTISNVSDLKITQLNDIQTRLSAIGKTTEILSEDSTVATSGIKNSLSEMKDSSTLLSELESNAKKLIEDSQTVELQFSEIKEKADQIESVVASIKSISERINMLSVNASIEAEINADKTESFKAVATEITKLSDSTAVAIIRISDMTSAMLNSVNAGIAEMKNFSLVMQTCKASIKNVRETIVVAQSTTLELSPKFEELSQNIYSHADNISNIETSLNRINEKSIESKKTLTLLKSKISSSAAIADALALKLKNFLNSNLRR